MAVYKCKMCGGALIPSEEPQIATCDYCGTRQTIPRLDSDKKAALYGRAEHFRRSDDFDKAAALYELILNEDPSDAESYWSLLLCRYGVEYVEDPLTHRRIPTCNRTQITSILADQDYRAALTNANPAQRALYEAEAKEIDEIQRGILAISRKEEPFDIFLCYKETDVHGQRTPDSVLAGELYHLLTAEGYRVFFSRVTLEDKIGSAYEPYIFAALSSARVMIVLGTRPEYFNAVWVKNEWSRYLALIKAGAQKTLIPAYKGMDPYALPDEFSHLQALDMAKLGFSQDLLHGLRKIAPPRSVDGTDEEETAAGVDALLRRISLFLEDRDFESAGAYCERVLDLEPENAEAYVCKLLVERRLTSEAELPDCDTPLPESGSYQKALRFAGPARAERLRQYAAAQTYNRAARLEVEKASEESLRRAAELFSSIPGYRDAAERARDCTARAESARLAQLYRHATELLSRNEDEDSTLTSVSLLAVSDLKQAREQFLALGAYEDAPALAARCEQALARFEAEAETKKRAEKKRLQKRTAALRRRKKLLLWCAAALVAALALLIFYLTFLVPNRTYTEAIRHYQNGEYAEAGALFLELGDFRDSALYLQDEKVALLTPGATVTFGQYPQSSEHGKEPICWNVLSVQGESTLLLSTYVLETLPFDEIPEEVIDYRSSWGTSSIRQWLNSNFLQTAFSPAEQTKLRKARVPDTPSGETTVEDYIVLLSREELDSLLPSDDERRAEATAYAARSQWSGHFPTSWWVRSAGNRENNYYYVPTDGSLSFPDCEYATNPLGIRPAIRVDNRTA